MTLVEIWLIGWGLFVIVSLFMPEGPVLGLLFGWAWPVLAPLMLLGSLK